jgi:hypothetical protein
MGACWGCWDKPPVGFTADAFSWEDTDFIQFPSESIAEGGIVPYLNQISLLLFLFIMSPRRSRTYSLGIGHLTEEGSLVHMAHILCGNQQ